MRVSLVPSRIRKRWFGHLPWISRIHASMGSSHVNDQLPSLSLFDCTPLAPQATSSKLEPTTYDQRMGPFYARPLGSVLPIVRHALTDGSFPRKSRKWSAGRILQ
jgi:hypothetical protein